MSLNEFNELFTLDTSESYAAVTKRREKKLDSFLKLLANTSSYNYEELLVDRKNETDKRIKEVLFLPNIIRVFHK